MPCCGRRVFATSLARWARILTLTSFGSCATARAPFTSPSMSTAAANKPRSSSHIVSGRRVSWINRYLDREYVRRLANTPLCTYAYNLLHFVRWWESVHPTGDIREGDLTESTLLDYVRFQSGQSPRPSPSI